ncbi:MAG TPA: hypothetical protein VFL34_02010, partial [Candidatus Sulfotelmatobacter sp.]|nr:hypothetical protein [Candidatus Sulfotelmatobacter sp.]
PAARDRIERTLQPLRLALAKFADIALNWIGFGPRRKTTNACAANGGLHPQRTPAPPTDACTAVEERRFSAA